MIGETASDLFDDVELQGTTEAAEEEFRIFTKRFVENPLQEGLTERYQLFLDACVAVNPHAAFAFDLQEAQDALRDRGDLSPLMRFFAEFNQQICYPAERVYSPVHVVFGGVPEFYDANVQGEWREHQTPYGESAYSVSVERINKRDTEFPQPAMTFGKYFFEESEVLREQSNDHYRYIQSSDETNAFWYALRTYLRVQGIDAAAYHEYIEADRTRFEELHHQHDMIVADKVSVRTGDSLQRALGDTLFVQSSDGHAAELWRDVRGTNLEQSMQQMTLEYAGQLDAVIDHLEQHLEQGEEATAYAVFLNFMGLMEFSRGVLKDISLQDQRRQQAVEACLRMPNGAYALLSDLLLREMDPPEGNPYGIVTDCQSQDEHPATVALTRLLAVRGKNLTTVEERLAMAA